MMMLEGWWREGDDGDGGDDGGGSDEDGNDSAIYLILFSPGICVLTHLTSEQPW